jgi:hypothetical protein
MPDPSTNDPTSAFAADSVDDVGRAVDEVLTVLDDLVEEYQRRAGTDVQMKRRDTRRARISAAFGAEAFASAHATRLLVRAGLASNAFATARRAFEFAATAAWLAAGR